jgi:hypothetical protein
MPAAYSDLSLKGGDRNFLLRGFKMVTGVRELERMV